MKKFKVRRSYLKILSAVSANLAAGWFAAMFLTPELLVLAGNIVGVIISLVIAVLSEEYSEKL